VTAFGAKLPCAEIRIFAPSFFDPIFNRLDRANVECNARLDEDFAFADVVGGVTTPSVSIFSMAMYSMSPRPKLVNRLLPSPLRLC